MDVVLAWLSGELAMLPVNNQRQSIRRAAVGPQPEGVEAIFESVAFGEVKI